MRLLGLLVAFVATFASVSHGLNMDTCSQMLLDGDLPTKDMFEDVEHAMKVLPFHNLAHVHPQYVKSLEHTALYMCAADNIVARDDVTNVDLVRLEKSVLNRTIEVTTALQASRQRFAREATFFDGLLHQLAQNGGVNVNTILNEVTNGWWNCVRNAVSTARDLYQLFVAGMGTLLDIVHTLASTIVDCISAATNSSPVGWLRRIWQGARLVLRASSIARDCGGLWSTYRQHGFNSFEMGKGVGRCINTLTRRRRAIAAEDVPEQWHCDPAFYGSNDGCDVGCGAFDPDCSEELEEVHYDLERHIDYVPPNITWNCPSIFFNGSDGCDFGCGAWDPDCGPARRNPPTENVYTWNATAAMTVAAENQYKTVLAQSTAPASGSGSDGSSSHNLSTLQLALIVAGTALVTMLVCVLVFAGLSRRRPRTATLGHKLVNQEEDVGEQAAYSLH